MRTWWLFLNNATRSPLITLSGISSWDPKIGSYVVPIDFDNIRPENQIRQIRLGPVAYHRTLDQWEDFPGSCLVSDTDMVTWSWAIGHSEDQGGLVNLAAIPPLKCKTTAWLVINDLVVPWWGHRCNSLDLKKGGVCAGEMSSSCK